MDNIFENLNLNKWKYDEAASLGNIEFLLLNAYFLLPNVINYDLMKTKITFQQIVSPVFNVSIF